MSSAKSPLTPEQRRLRALFILTGLIFSAVFFLLGLHAVLTGSGSLLWDASLGMFAGLSTIAMFSGVVFPLFALLIFPLFPVIAFYYYWKKTHRK